VALAAGVLLAGVLGAATYARHRDAPLLRLAVGNIVDLTGSDTLHTALALPELLTTGLGRYAPLEVVSRARLYDAATQLGAAPEPRELARAARQTGAGLLVDGALYRRSGGIFRLDLRLLDLERGTVRASYQVEGADVFALAELATGRLAADIGARRSAPVGDTIETTRSLAALQLYEQGLRAYYVGDGPSAERLFAAALKEDSAFAMAAYFAYRSANGISERAPTYLAQALRHAPHASERERLIIRATGAAASFDPARVALAETLAARFPAEPVAHVLLGEALVETRGDFAGARLAFRQAYAMDSLGLRDGVARCSACDAISGLATALMFADSMESAEREATKWTSRQPSAAGAWLMLAGVLAMRGDSAGAAAAFRKRSALVRYAPETMSFMVTLALRSGDFARAEHLVDNVLQTGNANERREALWWLAIIQRYEGRLAEALATSRALVESVPSDPVSRLLYAQVLFECGRTREALTAFETAGTMLLPDAGSSASVRARRRTWAMTHLTTVFAAMGDTARIAALVEPLRVSGAGSGYGRDRVMYHYARGLLWAARGEAGVPAELRAAIFSSTFGYTRVNVALAKLYLDRGQPEEAVPLLRAALHGPLEASNLYVTHTELHALLARAFAAMRVTDSVAVHRAYVERALARADAMGRARFIAMQTPTSADLPVHGLRRDMGKITSVPRPRSVARASSS
jgi:tetratricopeptide (TPR) repeat protein